jgi:archaemetzincin
MCGIHHCIHFSCLMNGSNHLKELDSQPLHLCPVCLRKLQSSAGCDVVARYEKLPAACDGAQQMTLTYVTISLT